MVNSILIRLALILALAVSSGCQSLLRGEQTGDVIAVVDGDTLTLLDAQRRIHKVRLAGIDAPNEPQPHSAAAKQALFELVFDKSVRVQVTQNQEGVLWARVFRKKQDINAELVICHNWKPRPVPQRGDCGPVRVQFRLGNILN